LAKEFSNAAQMDCSHVVSDTFTGGFEGLGLVHDEFDVLNETDFALDAFGSPPPPGGPLRA